MAGIHRPISGHFEGITFVCAGSAQTIPVYKSGLTGLFWHIIGMFIQKYESVSVDVIDTRSNRNFHLYVAPSTAAALAARVLGGASVRFTAASSTRSPSAPPVTAKVANLKRRQAEQLVIFEGYAQKHQWERFHTDHYDWWMFPVNRPSSYGDQYNFSATELESLRNDPEFMASYRRGVQLVALSYGWDTTSSTPVPRIEKGQGWRHYGVRLGKMATSLQLLHEKGLFQSMQQFARLMVDPLKVDGWVIESLRLR